jgi:hypothetical protein
MKQTMTKSDRLTHDGYRPITEGYQPGRPQPIQKGYAPVTNASGNAQQTPPPPRGGSSAAKPVKK